MLGKMWIFGMSHIDLRCAKWERMNFCWEVCVSPTRMWIHQSLLCYQSMHVDDIAWNVLPEYLLDLEFNFGMHN